MSDCVLIPTPNKNKSIYLLITKTPERGYDPFCILARFLFACIFTCLLNVTPLWLSTSKLMALSSMIFRSTFKLLLFQLLELITVASINYQRWKRGCQSYENPVGCQSKHFWHLLELSTVAFRASWNLECTMFPV